MKLKEINNLLKDARLELDSLEALQYEAIGRKVIACDNCKKKTTIGKLTYIDRIDYPEWDTCNDGPFHEGQYDCPSCGRRNRLINDKEKFDALKGHFKNKKKEVKQ